MPKGFGAPYWHLHKGLYSLQQARRQWYLHLHDAYMSLGYTRCKSDWSIYVRKSEIALSISATSVDNLLIASNSKTKSNLAAMQINKKFAVTDRGDTKWLLGCRIQQWRTHKLLMIDQEQYMTQILSDFSMDNCNAVTDRGDTEWLLGCRIQQWRTHKLLMIDQEQYMTQILSDFSMDNCNAVKTPCPMFHLMMEMCPKTDDERQEVAKLPYCALIGKCMYPLNCMRPDISFAICKLAKFMLNYGPKHFEAVKHLLQYLQEMHGRGIIYRNLPNPYPIFTSFTDSDWAMSEGHKSNSGFIMQCANGPLTWSSKQQVVVVLSSCEVEYIACSYCAHQVLWLQTLFHKLGFPQTKPTPLYCDN